MVRQVCYRRNPSIVATMPDPSNTDLVVPLLSALPVGDGNRRPEPSDNLMYIYSALPIAACATATGRLRRRNAPRSASSALLARRSTRLADGLQVDVAGRDTLRIAARRTCIFAVASSDPGRGLPSTNLPLPAIGTIANDPLCAPLADRL